MISIAEHPLRYAIANELHARPFPAVVAPCRAAYLATKPAENAAGRDREADRAHLIALLDRFGAQHPKPDSTHYFTEIGKYSLKWECHTEFVTYTVFAEGVAERPFDPDLFSVFPSDWLAACPGTRLTSALIRIEVAEGDDGILEKVQDWFVNESLAVSRVLDDGLVIAGDFRIDSAAHMRFGIFARPDAVDRRVGRVVQYLCEVETYKAMSMLALYRVRSMSSQLREIDSTLNAVVSDMVGPITRPDDMLQSLLGVSAQLESIITKSSFRFGAAEAYEAIVNQRIDSLREERFQEQLQTFAEFMMRRFDPAMRTVKSTQLRLSRMSDRAQRASDLLRTRVDVERSAQNQELLTSMDRRADLQLRLQRTVEGLSVVAITYYAVNLVLYVLAPLEEHFSISKTLMGSLATPVVLAGVWFLVQRIRKHLH